MVLNEEHTDIDSVGIQIPEGYSVESTFPNTNIETRFGTFSALAKVTPGKIIYYRKQVYFSGRFPATQYAELVNYYQQVYKSDHSRIVLVKEE